MEAWEKVYVKKYDDFAESVHGKVGCVICHSGNSREEDKELAHAGLKVDPSAGSCDTCHKDIALVNATSMHTTLSGFKYNLEARGGNLEEGSELAVAFQNHCQQCHTSCGQCHVSRPEELGGGFVSGHEFRKTPSTQYNCVACHGARVGDEYLGENEGIPGDVHWVNETVTCTSCHGQELHGTGEIIDTRYQNPATVSCIDCHEDVWTNAQSNPQHEQHLEDLACQVCHSVTYKNCYNCHVSLDKEGIPCRTSDPSEMHFEIGLNPISSPERPYKYVVLRHVPTCPDVCEFYGVNLLPDCNCIPTWKYTTPHNIQLDTPQNESCNSCHGNAELFLTEEDVDVADREMNRSVIVKEVPQPQPE